MLVYGDASREEDPRATLAGALACHAGAMSAPAGIRRHAALVAAFIALGALAQGLADAEFEHRGQDADSPVQDAALRLLAAAAESVLASWQRGLAAPAAGPAAEPAAGAAAPCGDPPPARPTVEPARAAAAATERRTDTLGAAAALARLPLPPSIRIKRAEGFAHYALYPESYLLAARRSSLGRDTAVIGLRSIGAPLAALVAAALGAPPPVTLRPIGHPFRRSLALAPALAARLTAHPGPFAIVDEGPGLSGSSIAAVLRLLDQAGVAPTRIHVFPGHDGPPGPQASPADRALWSRITRHPPPDILPAHLPAWIADLTGPAEAPPRDLSAGAWRALHHGPPPPTHAQQERRKFLLRAGGRDWLLKFAGLGAAPEHRLAQLQPLSQSGHIPPIAGLRHGVLVQPWLEAAPLPRRLTPDLARRIGHYLGLRARLPAPSPGASPETLWHMACHNTAEALGPAAADALRRHNPDLAALARRIRPGLTDNRLHRWEWLHRPDGTPCKTDALDHHAAHDLVGCQDLGWDIAGAAIELALRGDALDALIAAAEHAAGRHVSRTLLRFYLPCYLAFQLGHWRMAEDVAPTPDEAARIRRLARRYARLLRIVIAQACRPALARARCRRPQGKRP